LFILQLQRQSLLNHSTMMPFPSASDQKTTALTSSVEAYPLIAISFWSLATTLYIETAFFCQWSQWGCMLPHLGWHSLVRENHIVWHPPVHDVDCILLDEVLNVLAHPRACLEIKAAGSPYSGPGDLQSIFSLI